MNSVDWLKQISRIRPLGARISRRMQDRHDKKVLKSLSSTSYPQGEAITAVLTQLEQELSQPEKYWIKGIETERENLLSRNELLVDGSLGEGGIYDLGLTVRQACQASKPSKPGLLLYLLTRTLTPRRVIELGTNVGISSSFIAAALKLNEEQGTLTTLDVSPYRQRLAKEVHSNLGLDNVTYVQGLFADTLRHSLDEMGSVDLAFIDGHHQYRPTLDYYEEIMRIATQDTIFVFDDIRWSVEMKKAWLELQADKRLGMLVDLKSIGICVRARESAPLRYVFPPLYNPF